MQEQRLRRTALALEDSLKRRRGRHTSSMGHAVLMRSSTEGCRNQPELARTWSITTPISCQARPRQTWPSLARAWSIGDRVRSIATPKLCRSRPKSGRTQQSWADPSPHVVDHHLHLVDVHPYVWSNASQASSSPGQTASKPGT